jgi:Tfp pilus assembly protein PilF
VSNFVRLRAVYTASLLLVFTLAACKRGDTLPEPSSEAYQETVAAFYTGLAALQAGTDVGAEDNLRRAAELAPGEPALWANLGVLAIRQNRFEDAREWLERAQSLAPDNSHIETLLALLYSNQGDLGQAEAHLRRAIELEPANLHAMFALAQVIERQGGPETDAEVQQLLDTLLQEQPDNLILLLEQVRLAARRGDQVAAAEAVQHLAPYAESWPDDVQEQFTALQTAVSSDLPQAATQVTFLRNSLLPLPAYRRDLAAVQGTAGQIGELMPRFVRLPAPVSAMAAADSQLTFTPEPATDSGQNVAWAGAVWLNAEQGPALALMGPEAHLGSAVLPALPGAGTGLTPLDFNYDFLTDVLMAGPGGLRLYRHDSIGTFTNVTAQMGLPAAVTAGRYNGAWAADIDSEGDIDLVLGVEGAPLVLRNNGDGTFESLQPFTNITNVRDFTWADLDADGDPDAALLDAAGRLHVRLNERMGQFSEQPLPDGAGSVAAITATDLNSNGLNDLIVLGTDGGIRRLSREDDTWVAEELGQWDNNTALSPDTDARLLAADLDNNGGLDLIASDSTTAVWLQRQDGSFQPLNAGIDATAFDVADLNGDGRQDLIGVQNGAAVRLLNQGTADYHWQVIRPQASLAAGDQRINSFGIGGEVEVRTGMLFQKQPITAPAVHFGLGDHEAVEVARIVWPNGDVQAEFSLQAGQVITTPQRLKGSCPWLFTFDGEGMQFVTDFIWRSPLGLAINAQETAGIAMTEDRIKIRGDQLVPRDGFYDLRITAELWETHFFDHVSLLVVDHPAGTEMHVDERFAFPPPDLTAQITTPVQPVAGAWDHTGNDVAAMVRERDGVYLDSFGPGAYQGVTQDHYVEVEIPDQAPEQGLRLMGFGWIRPTDSSINVAIAQGSHAPPAGLSMEVPDGQGGWRTVQEGLGFPAGKLKTVVLNLDGVFQPGTPRRLRLRTNLEIYWDALGWAVAQPGAEARTQHLMPQMAELRYRGFSQVVMPDRSSPDVPVYELEGTAQRWRDLEGYYTRFGDVRELLQQVDDRYVIMNAGDEMRFLFPALAPPPDGWLRDFVLIGDGWVKDGDYNTAFSRTVHPLPAHDITDYSTPPGALTEDPVYQRHPEDWQVYHTRYVTPERFHYALRPD